TFRSIGHQFCMVHGDPRVGPGWNGSDSYTRFHVRPWSCETTKAFAESSQDCDFGSNAITVQNTTINPWHTVADVTWYRFPGIAPPMRSTGTGSVVRMRPAPVCSACTTASPAPTNTSRYATPAR